jgi:hypothetical protein
MNTHKLNKLIQDLERIYAKYNLAMSNGNMGLADCYDEQLRHVQAELDRELHKKKVA